MHSKVDRHVEKFNVPVETHTSMEKTEEISIIYPSALQE